MDFLKAYLLYINKLEGSHDEILLHLTLNNLYIVYLY